MAGDILDIQHLLFDKADHNVQVISDAEVLFFPMRDFRRLLQERPEIGKALWRDCLVDASIFREWVLNVGRRDSRSRLAHLLCEFALRLEVHGIARPDHGYALPMTQEQLADATGLTSVHVNRVLKVMETEGLILRNRRNISFPDWRRLREVGDFNQRYLHLRDREELGVF
jgi:CRP-like cAMP-binding protein